MWFFHRSELLYVSVGEMMGKPKTSGLYLVTLSIVLMVVWLVWSGIYKPLLITFGVISVAITVAISHYLSVIDDEGQPISLGVRPFWYVPWLLKEIVVSNIDVMKKILHPKLNDPEANIISPTWIKVSATQCSRLGQSLFANSITLTPGTVSVDVGEDYIWVHALSKDGAESLIDGGEMGTLVCKLEGAE